MERFWGAYQILNELFDYFIFLDMKLSDTQYFPLIMVLYERLCEVNEPYDLETSHSDLWLQIFYKLVEATEGVSKLMWPNAEIDSENFQYEKTVLSILRNYDKERGSFDKYFITSLCYNLMRKQRDINMKKLDETRYFHIPVRAQKKINRCLAIVKKYNKEHSENEQVTIYDEKIKNVFLERNIFKDKADMEKILQLNYESFNLNKFYSSNTAFFDRENETIIEQAEESTSGNKIFSKNKFVSILDILEGLSPLFSFIDECYKSKIQLKKQNPEAQIKKEAFLREVLTCHYYRKYKKLTDKEDLSDEKILRTFYGRSFTSKEILQIFIDHDKKLEAMARSGDKQQMAELSALINTSPVTIESISTAFGKPKNYGAKVLGDFKKYLKEQAVVKNIPEEIVQLI